MQSEGGGSKKRIMVVDDEEAALDLAQVKLNELGYDVIKATNGRDCLKIAETEKPDLILLDIMMPELDGGNTAQLLLDNPKTKDIPVIFLTSLISPEEELKDLGEIKGRLFVAKPLDSQRLSAAIKKALED